MLFNFRNLPLTITFVIQSVPPAFAALKKMRKWMSTGIKDAPLPLPDMLRERYAWWEDVVEYVSKEIGTLCLV